MAFIHSCFTKTNNHSPALFEINTGFSRMGFPCMGAWITYGLGSENRNLPGFVVMYDTLGRGLPKGHAQNWGAGFLPGVFQGTALNAQAAPINNLYRRSDMTDQQQLAQLDLLRTLNKHHPDAGEADLAARIESFELAYRMQMAAPEALDIDIGARAHPKAVRHRRQALHALRQAGAHGPAAGRARRTLRADLFGRHGERAELGRPRQHQG